jgi:hypothetical protein
VRSVVSGDAQRVGHNTRPSTSPGLYARRGKCYTPPRKRNPDPARTSCYCGFFELAGKYSCICCTVSFRASERPSSTLKIGT